MPNVSKGCENIRENVPIRHQNIRERNCQSVSEKQNKNRQNIERQITRNKSRNDQKGENIMYLAEVRKVGSMMIRNLNKPRNHKNLFKFCKRKYSLKVQESRFAK